MVKQKFIQFFDINTSPDNFSVLTVKAGGQLVRQRLAPFFSAYKYYKLGRVNVKCVPASTLPVDPTGLSYEAGESTVDPRDQFNPGLVRITNGEDIASASTWDMNRYYATMLDKRWYKFRLQGGFSRSAVPLVWNIAQNHQAIYPDARFINGVNGENTQLYDASGNAANGKSYVKAELGRGLADIDNYLVKAYSVNPGGVEQNVTMINGDVPGAEPAEHPLYVDGGGSGGMMPYPNLPDGLPYMVQNQRVRLGWMPTDVGGPTEEYYKMEGDDPVTTPWSGYAPIPEVDLMTFVLPKAFKTKFYYRVFIESTVYFKDPVVIDPFGSEATPMMPVDRFGAPARLNGNYHYPE